MAGHRSALGLLLAIAACAGSPQFEFPGYQYPEQRPGSIDDGYFYNHPVAPPAEVPHNFFQSQPVHFPVAHSYRSAVCVLSNTSTSEVSGTIQLFQGTPHEPVVVSGVVEGLEAGNHGMHIHRDGKLGNDCVDAGPHFNPENFTHAGPQDKKRHAGDLGNIEAGPTGVADFAVLSDRVSLLPTSKFYVVGRAVVVHAREDDLGKGGDAESLRTGNAGARLACCVIRPHVL